MRYDPFNYIDTTTFTIVWTNFSSQNMKPEGSSPKIANVIIKHGAIAK